MMVSWVEWTGAYSESFRGVTFCENERTLLRRFTTGVIRIIKFRDASNALSFSSIILLKLFALLEVSPS